MLYLCAHASHKSHLDPNSKPSSLETRLFIFPWSAFLLQTALLNTTIPHLLHRSHQLIGLLATLPWRLAQRLGPPTKKNLMQWRSLHELGLPPSPPPRRSLNLPTSSGTHAVRRVSASRPCRHKTTHTLSLDTPPQRPPHLAPSPSYALRPSRPRA